MLILVKRTVAAAIHIIVALVALICNKAPITMMLDIAFVTLIKGVCSAGETFQITM